jgi:uncharacterized protein
MPSSERLAELDIAKGIGLCLVAFGNAAPIGHLGMRGPFLPAGWIGSVNHLAEWLHALVVTNHGYSVMAFAFGFGLAQQVSKYELLPILKRYTFLVFCGLFNITFFFAGDVLVIYAFWGFVLVFFRTLSAKKLFILAFVLLALDFGRHTLNSMAEIAWLPRQATVLTIQTPVGFWAAVEWRWLRYTTQLPAIISTLTFPAMIALGMSWAVAQNDRRSAILFFSLVLFLLGTCVRVYALPFAGIDSATWYVGGAALFVVSGVLSAPGSALGVLAISRIARSMKVTRFALRPLAIMGAMPLSTYMVTTMLMVLFASLDVFRLFPILGRLESWGLSAISLALTYAVLVLWTKRFARGPFEGLAPKLSSK